MKLIRILLVIAFFTVAASGQNIGKFVISDDEALTSVVGPQPPLAGPPPQPQTLAR